MGIEPTKDLSPDPSLVLKTGSEQRNNRRKSDPGNDHQPDFTHKRAPFDPISRHDSCQTDPDLARIVDAWPSVPENIRASILMLVKAALGK